MTHAMSSKTKPRFQHPVRRDTKQPTHLSNPDDGRNPDEAAQGSVSMPLPATSADVPVLLSAPTAMGHGEERSGTFSAEILEWVIEHARAGVTAQAVTDALIDNGWSAEGAALALQQAISLYAPGYVQNPRVTELHAFVIPEPLLADGARSVDCGDRQVEVVMSSLLPRVVVFDDFLDNSECDQLMALAAPKMTPSTVIEAGTGNGVQNPVRTSTGMFFSLQEEPLIDRIERRIERCLNWPLSHGEGLQVLNYQPGAEYQPHQDFFDPNDPGTPKAIGFSGQRVGTLLLYLNTPQRGGSTVFPDGGIEVHAKKGRAVFFSYDTPCAQKRALHGGAPVIEGEKWVATKWLRQKPWKPKFVPSPTA